MIKNINNRFFLIFGLIILSFAGYGYFKSVPGVEDKTSVRPQIEISPAFFDFGTINYGQVVEYSFKFKNIGQDVLEIKRVATSCACTTAKASSKRIQPGEEAELQVKYDSGAMSGSHGRGRQERIIYIKSSDPVNPQVEVMVYADVR